MRTVVLGPPPRELEVLMERRRRQGLDLFDEVWGGEYHLAPAPHPWHGYLDDELAVLLRPLALRAGLVGTGPFNLGEPGDFRVPDRGFHRTMPATTFVATAAVVVEIVSPDDETWSKLDFYASRGVDELFIVDPLERTVAFLALEDRRYERRESSALLSVTSEELGRRIRWPEAT